MTGRYAGTSIAERPTFSGPAGSAWRIRFAAAGQRARADFDATLDGFVVQVPGAHVFWDHWLVSVIHLRPIEGVKPAYIRTPGATHELMIAALNPERPLPGLDAGGAEWAVSYLTPLDVVEQFQVENDAVAADILELAVQNIVAGVASPDQDWRNWWASAVAHTAGHYADGTHSTGRVQ